MSLRIVYRIAIALFLLALALLAGWYFRQTTPIAAPGALADIASLQDLAEPSRGYVLRPGGPGLEFVLPPSANIARIQLNANLASIEQATQQRRADPNRRWRYALLIEELDEKGRTLQERVHHFRRDLVELQLPRDLRGTGVFYLDKTLPQPLGTSTLRVRFGAAARPQRLRIKLVSADEDIRDVLLRVAVPEPLTQRSAATMWQRLSDVQRRKLASGNLYPAEVLIEQERINLLESRWTPLGPDGDPVERDLQVLLSDQTGPPTEVVKPVVPTVSPTHHAVLQLPENGGRFRIVLDPVDPVQSGSATPASVTVAWSGHSAFQRSTQNYDWRDGPLVIERAFDGGWLDVSSTRLATIRIIQIDADGERDVTPPIEYLRTWIASDAAPLEYAVSHAGNLPTPLRLSLRRIHDGETKDAPVNVQFLNAEGVVQREMSVTPDLPTSVYDQVWPEVAGLQISDPQDVFFNVPAGVKRVRITAPTPVMVSAFTRPGDLPRAVRTPEDSVQPEAADVAIPAWFPLPPIDHELRILNGASQLLTVQRRPPEERPELAAGRYVWEDFDPKAGGAARVFLAPREPGMPERPDAAATTYRPLPQDGRVDLAVDPLRDKPLVRLVWISDAPTRFSYVVRVDGNVAVRGTGAGAAGEIVLPDVSAGRHRIAVDGPPGLRWYINYAREGTPWIRRTAYRFDRPLSFEVERVTTDEQFVSVRLFRPAGADERMRVRVRVDPPGQKDIAAGPLPYWLLTERVHDVRPSGELALPVAETGGDRADAGQPFFIALPEGAPRGRYRITLLPEGGKAWITVSRLTTGARAKPVLIVEETGSAGDED